MTLQEHLSDLTYGRSLIFGLAVAGIYYFVAFDSGSGLKETIQSTKQSIAVSQAEKKKIEQAIIDAKRFEETRDKLGDQLGQLLKYLPEDISVFQLMKLLSEEARGAGVNILDITDSPISGAQEKSEFFEEIPVQVRLEGTYNGLLIFLSNITKIDKVITVKDMEINVKFQGSVKDSDSKNPTLSLTGVISAYRFLPEDKREKKESY